MGKLTFVWTEESAKSVDSIHFVSGGGAEGAWGRPWLSQFKVWYNFNPQVFYLNWNMCLLLYERRYVYRETESWWC